MNISKSLKKGFTLVELLVVVAIIAIIGAGVAVSYRGLTDKAATAMEISDLSILQKAITQWSAINDGKILNGMDLLVSDTGKLYASGGPSGFSLKVITAPEAVLEKLSGAGMKVAYKHLSKATVANDSTYESGRGGAVDTTKTAVMLEYITPEDVKAANLLLDKGTLEKFRSVANNDTAFMDTDPTIGGILKHADNSDTDPMAGTRFEKTKIATEAEFAKLAKEAQIVVNSGIGEAGKEHLKMAFLRPPAPGDSMPMNQFNDIVTNLGMRPEDIADPAKVNEKGEYEGENPGSYFLVVMGLGRFASIYQGKSVSLDLPAYGKRGGQESGDYNRYLCVFRVPTGAGYDMMTRSGGRTEFVGVLTPQLYTAAKLRSKYISAESNERD